jgi:flagellar basal-body rod protein FlgB
MYLEGIGNRSALPALEKTLAFNEARLRMIAENVANVHTPGYRARQLEPAGFQSALRAALEEKGTDPSRRLVVDDGKQVATRPDGTLRVTPTLEPVEAVLFHDGTNLSMERQMADLAETGMMHELTTTLMRGYFDGLRKAIRGTA